MRKSDDRRRRVEIREMRLKRRRMIIRYALKSSILKLALLVVVVITIIVIHLKSTADHERHRSVHDNRWSLCSLFCSGYGF